MYSDLKERIVPLLPSLDSSTCKEILAILDEYELKMKSCICWSTEDVIGRAKEAYKIILSEDEAQTILEEMIDNHDCIYGITWDHVDSAVWEAMSQHQKDHYEKLRDYEQQESEQEDDDYESKENEVRAGTCPVLGTQVLQQYYLPDGEWLCLHNDTVEEDGQKVDHFKKTGQVT